MRQCGQAPRGAGEEGTVLAKTVGADGAASSPAAARNSVRGTEPGRCPVGRQVLVRKTAELVARSLRRQIISGELGQGEALPPESALMEQFGVSRPTLREAFRVLESES